MPRLPLVAIIGRPNTGKSTLFNRLVGRRQAIESSIPGTTRDHIAGRVETDEIDYLLIDTGGMGGGTEDKDFEDDVHAQSMIALEAADVILFTVNAKEEITKSDRQIVEILRKKRKRHVPVLLVITKIDAVRNIDQVLPSYHELGITNEMFPVSAAHNQGTAELEDAITKHLQKLKFQKDLSPKSESRSPKIAIIGKPNVGKSSLINALMSDTQRKISPKLVSDVPGTTRDATDTVIKHEEKDFIFVDTAGLRRPARIEEDLEGLSTLRSIQAIEQCDIAILVLDGTQPISHQDKRIAGLAVEQGKGLILLLNKMDLVKGEAREEQMLDIKRNFLFCRWAPVLPASTVTRDGLLKLFPLIEMIQRNRIRQIPGKELFRWLKDTLAGQPMVALATARRIEQGEDPPPVFFLYVKDPRKVQLSQLRFLENRLRETFGLEGVPVKLITKRGGRRAGRE